jgi:Na+/H+ antiporter NhaD/arsenite permease-like protein
MLDPSQNVPGIVWATPFVALLLSIAILPLVPRVSHWWEKNSSKLLVAILLAGAITAYYLLRGYGLAESASGFDAAKTMLHHALLEDYIPFIVLLFSLYSISGGIRFSGDVPAHPITNAVILLGGSLLASFIGTTGASMLLIRPLLQINSERKHVTHTVIFFIFLVSNIGGVLLPVGDPPLFLGFLRGVPFFWTLCLIPHWAVAVAVLLVVYYVIESIAHHREAKPDLSLDESVRVPLKLEGKRNFVLLAAVVALVATFVPGKPFLGSGWVVPGGFLREALELALVALSFLWTPKAVRKENDFNFGPIAEVACLFVGIFVTMQVPLEILRIQGAALGIDSPVQFFWASGLLSSFLDNAPTYTVFFELAGAIPSHGMQTLSHVATGTGVIPVRELMGIAAGSVFMGANTYIGNGPNFLVRGIAESQGVKMPSFFGYMAWSGCILIPLFILISAVFFR